MEPKNVVSLVSGAIAIVAFAVAIEWVVSPPRVEARPAARTIAPTSTASTAATAATAETTATAPAVASATASAPSAAAPVPTDSTTVYMDWSDAKASRRKPHATVFARASMLALGEQNGAARALLEPRVASGEAIPEEISLLRHICKKQHDAACVAKLAGK